MKAYLGTGVVVPNICNYSEARLSPSPLDPGEIAPVPLKYEAGWPSEPVSEKRKSLEPAGIRSPKPCNQ
jgi:hypothetical protein